MCYKNVCLYNCFYHIRNVQDTDLQESIFPNIKRLNTGQSIDRANEVKMNISAFIIPLNFLNSMQDFESYLKNL